MPGPVPKRSDQRRRRNKPQFGLDKVDGAAGEAPVLDVDDAHPLAAEWYSALSEGAEAAYYTPALWQRARVAAAMLSRLLYSDRPSSNMYAAIQSDMKSLLVDAGELRRLGIEVQAADADVPDNVIDYRARARAGA